MQVPVWILATIDSSLSGINHGTLVDGIIKPWWNREDDLNVGVNNHTASRGYTCCFEIVLKFSMALMYGRITLTSKLPWLKLDCNMKISMTD